MIDIILKSPLYSGNLGMIARIAKNFNIQTIKLVNPLCVINKESFKFAPNAHDTLLNMEIFPDLEQALSKYVLVFGTTARKGGERNQSILTPWEAAYKATQVNGKIAVVVV